MVWNYGDAIVDEQVCIDAAKQEIIRRLYNAKCDMKRGTAKEEPIAA